MHLFAAVDAIREKLIGIQLADGADLWSAILRQIRSADSFDGRHADTILEVIGKFVRALDDEVLISVWRETDTGMADDAADEELVPDSVRMDLEMELLEAVTNTAWHEAGRMS